MRVDDAKFFGAQVFSAQRKESHMSEMSEHYVWDGLRAMVRAYIDCALWASNGDGGLEAEYTIDDLALSTLELMHEDCAAFADLDPDDVAAYLNVHNAVQLGQDFWLTRNGHSAGFWDRGDGLLGERLTMRAKTFGECLLYVGDNGKVYASMKAFHNNSRRSRAVKSCEEL